MPLTEALVPSFDQPDILLAYADRELTILGITGTLQDLADMCPIDLNDPRITQEAKTEFAIKALNESGQAIDPEHEDLFTKVIEKNNLQRKFTVNPDIKALVVKDEPKQTNKSPQAKEIKQINDSSKAVTGLIPKKPELGASVLRAQSANRLQEQLDVSVVLETQTIHDQDIVQVMLKQADEDLAKQPENMPIADMETQPQRSDQESGRKSALTEYLATITQTEDLNVFDTAIDQLSVDGNDPIVEVKPIVLDDISERPIIFSDSPIDYQQQSPTEPIKEDMPAEAPSKTLEISWQDELSKEPEEQCQDFTQALQNLVELMSDPPIPGDNETSAVQLDNTETQETVLRDIVIVMADRLTKMEINDRELVVPVMQNIISQLNNIQLLKTQEIEPEIILEAETKLKELVIVLFEAVGLDCNEQQAEQLIWLMLSPNFQPPQRLIDQEEIDLEKNGTREAKITLRIAQLGTNFIDAEDKLLQALGMFALFWVQGIATPAFL